jgi:hypothetical protein
MSIENPNFKKNTGPPSKRPLLRSEIEEAQRHTRSNKAAARYMQVSYRRYRRYAMLYNLFDSHCNQEGIGLDKGWAKRASTIPLRDILAGKHPKYSMARLKNRLIARKKLVEQCASCGFNERRITDKKVPLMLTFLDGNHLNYSLSNLALYCYNCMFLTTGSPNVVNKIYIEKSFIEPQKIPKSQQIPIVTSDYYDTEDLQLADINIILSDDELRELHDQ